MDRGRMICIASVYGLYVSYMCPKSQGRRTRGKQSGREDSTYSLIAAYDQRRCWRCACRGILLAILRVCALLVCH